MGNDFEIEADLARARTLPARLYFDPATLDEERRRVFGRNWQLVAHAEALAHPGDFVCGEVAGEPVVLTRDEAGVLHALSAVCRHRAGPVAQGAGRRGTLQCGYHGWTYALDGRLLGTPEWEGVRDFEPAAHGLPAFRVETWGPFVFVNLDPGAAPLSAALGRIPAETRQLPLERMRLAKRLDYELACNWKTYVDNYLEGYHIPLVHPALHRELDYAAYRVETFEGHSRQHAPYRADSRLRSMLAPGEADQALYYWLFPNLMLNLYPGNLQLNLVLPLAAERTLARFEWYALEPERPGFAEQLAESIALSDQVQREDMAICEAVQRGLRSRTYRSGRLSVRRENGVHHFHGLLARALGGSPRRD